tara:strand:- start:67 stop:327 length:261 start_codon:yes stop_codon:yes gene_type:complete
MTIKINKLRQNIIIKALQDHRDKLISMKSDAAEVKNLLTDIREYKKDIEDREKMENELKETRHPQTGERLDETIKTKKETGNLDRV